MNTMKNIYPQLPERIFNSIKYRLTTFLDLLRLSGYKLFPINPNLIVFESNGDCCDNAYALFDYMRSNEYIGKYKVIWLVDHIENFQDNENVSYAYKRAKPFYTAKTLKAIATCNWYIYDHVNVIDRFKRRKGQNSIYLCHGYAGFKASTSKGNFKADYAITTGKIPKQGCNDWLKDGIKTEILGFSRLDYFYNKNQLIEEKINNLINPRKFKINFLWMPTFRKSNIKSLSEDYLNNTETGLPLLITFGCFEEFNKYLQNINVQLVLKLHPLQASFDFFNCKFSNIKILKNEDLEREGIQLYQFIPIFDALITDYSSISTDYFLLDKPIVYILDDIEEYKKSRGLYPENALDYMPGDHVYNIDELKAAIERILNGEDKYRKERNELLPLFHTYQDGNASKRILDHLGIIK